VALKSGRIQLARGESVLVVESDKADMEWRLPGGDLLPLCCIASRKSAPVAETSA